MSENFCQLKKSKTLAPIVNALFASIMPGEHTDSAAAEILATVLASESSLKTTE